MTQKELGKRIKTFREMRGMTQAEVAADLKLVPQTLSKWERGLSSPSICELPSLCRALGINLSLLLDEDTGHEEYMIAIDGGATKTDLVLFTREGVIVKKVSTGGTNPNVIGIDACETLLCSAIDSLMISHSNVKRIYAAIAGTSSGDNGSRLFERLKKRYPAYKINVESDIMNIIGLTRDNSRCSAAIVGTGSVVFAWDGKKLSRLGGWGYRFDGAGSGYDIGRDMITLALEAGDGIKEYSEAARLVEIRLGSKAFCAIDKIYGGGSEYIASFAPLAFIAAKSGDREAMAVIERSAERVAMLIRESVSRFNTGNTVIIGGGITSEELFRDMLKEKLGDKITAEFASCAPIFGAMRRCLDLSGADYSFDSLKEKFKESFNK